MCLKNRCVDPKTLKPVRPDPYTQCRIDCAKERDACKARVDAEWLACMSHATTDQCEPPRWRGWQECDAAYNSCDGNCINLL